MNKNHLERTKSRKSFEFCNIYFYDECYGILENISNYDKVKMNFIS